MRIHKISSLVLTFALGLGCKEEPTTCDLNVPTMGCEDGQVCEMVGDKPTCTAPVLIRGRVNDGAAAAISQALVAVLDANDAPASGAATSDATGAYELRVPIARTADGKPVQKQVKLRGSAAGFETFPSGIRRSLPIELSTATMVDGAWVVESAVTNILLFGIPNPGGRGSLAGTVQNGEGTSGALIIVEGAAKATAISDVNGAYEVFNLPPGAYTVKGYMAGTNLMAAAGTVAAGARTPGVDLRPIGAAAGSVAGDVNFVNPGSGMTSVVLVPEVTFDDVLKRGEVPPGLRAPRTGPPTVTGPFIIEGVPDGTYLVLASFENDLFVRDPDTSIGGTAIQRVTIAGAQVRPPQSFKVTGALAVTRPGAGDAPEKVAGNPMMVWDDDSSEDKYTVEVFGRTGRIWGPIDVQSVSGPKTVELGYAGPALTKGDFYQFRAVSWKSGIPLSSTEDLRGVWIAD